MPLIGPLTADVTDTAAGTNTTTGLSFPTAIGRYYSFWFWIGFTISDIADGAQFIVDTPTVTTLHLKHNLPTSTSSDTILHAATDSAEVSATSAAVTTGNFHLIQGFGVFSVAGAVEVFVDSEATADVVVKKGSHGWYRDLGAL